MGQADYFLLGSWNYICDQCGEKFKATQALREWDGLMVCRQCWDYRHPQDFIRAVPERPIPWSRPCPPTYLGEITNTELFIDGNFIDSNWIG